MSCTPDTAVVGMVVGVGGDVGVGVGNGVAVGGSVGVAAGTGIIDGATALVDVAVGGATGGLHETPSAATIKVQVVNDHAHSFRCIFIRR